MYMSVAFAKGLPHQPESVEKQHYKIKMFHVKHFIEISSKQWPYQTKIRNLASKLAKENRIEIFNKTDLPMPHENPTLYIQYAAAIFIETDKQYHLLRLPF